jgi:hypothetical protein
MRVRLTLSVLITKINIINNNKERKQEEKK